MYTIVEAQPTQRLPIVQNVCGILHRLIMRQAHADAVGFTRNEGMTDSTCTNAQFTVGSDVITQCGFQVEVGNACAPVELASFELVVEVVAVIADDEGRVEEPATAEVVRPAQGARSATYLIAPTISLRSSNGITERLPLYSTKSSVETPTIR